MTVNSRILLVDDDSDISLALSDFLRQENFDVDTANTASTALKKGLANQYDAILLDIGLPDRDGIEVLGEFAKHKPGLPVILLTAFTSLDKSTPPDILNKAFAYLTKPYRREEVRNVLCRAINTTKQFDSQRKQPTTNEKLDQRFPSIVQPSSQSTPKTIDSRYQFSLEEYQRLTEHIQLMQFAFDHVPEAILIADTKKHFRFANQAATDLLGYTQQELEALRIPDIAPNHDSQRYQEHLEELRQGKTLTYFTTHRTKQGKDLPIEISVYLLNFQGQEFTCAITKETCPAPHHEPSPPKLT